MINKFWSWFKSFFKKKIYLPLWFGFFPGHDITPEQEEYYETCSKIANYFIENPNGQVILKVNNIPIILTMVNGNIELRQLNKDEYTYE